MTSTDQRTYTVSGMTCNHCVLSVREEVSEVAGVRGVGGAHDAGQLTVAGVSLNDDAIRAAVAEAGYEVV